jgi:transposase-like protein
VPEEPKPPVPTSDLEQSGILRPVPRCPSCGWGDVRVSYTKGALDVILGMISVQRFKCRSCGLYFRRWYRAVD